MYLGNPQCFNPYSMPKNTNNGGNCIALVVILIVVSLLFMLLMVDYAMKIECGPTIVDYGDIRPRKIKKYIAPPHGTITLSNGVGKQIHHNIDETSVIMLSRKNVIGTNGMIVIDEIEEDKHFTIKSIDEDGNVEIQDQSEVYFTIYN